jgi:O-antigen/teichoic acid export membrane protein
MSAGIAAVADLIVAVMLGPKWLAAVPVIQILGIAAVFHICSSNTAMVYVMMGKPQIAGLLSLGWIAVMVPLLIHLIGQFGIVGAAMGSAIGAALLFIASMLIVTRVLNLGFGRLAAIYWRPVLSTAAMWAGLALLRDVWPAGAEAGLPIVQLVAFIAFGAAVFVLAELALWHASGRPDTAERLVLNAANGGWRRIATQLSS